jgi:hypothetical protein
MDVVERIAGGIFALSAVVGTEAGILDAVSRNQGSCRLAD